MDNSSISKDVNKLSRIEFLKDQFITDYKKSIKKGKLLNISSQDFKRFVPHLDQQVLKSMQQRSSNSGIDITNVDSMGMFIDPAFFAFRLTLPFEDTDVKRPSYDLMFDFFVQNDPTVNKEYLHWFLNLYKDLIKKRKPFSSVNRTLDADLVQDGSFREMLMGGVENRFFEDLFKVREVLEKFDFLKKTKSLHESKKDIGRFENYSDLINLIKPFMPAEEGSSDVDTLDHKELKALENEFEYQKTKDVNLLDQPRAKVVFQNDDWVIVVTINKEANVVYGKYTTWCTAGTRYGNMFSQYADKGSLFVLIKKGKGSKQEIDKNPRMRLQFHFETKQYMDALDKPIKIDEFLNQNIEIKKYFKGYIVKEVLPKKGSKYTDHIDLLTQLGYGDQLIQIYKEIKPKEIEICKVKLDPKDLNELGEITSLEKLTLQECELDELPESLQYLTKLKVLDCASNKTLKVLPKWLNKLTQLKSMQFTDCDIQSEVDLTGLVNLEQIRFDMNKNMKIFPKGIDSAKKVTSATFSSCNIETVPLEILNCDKLHLLDLSNNMRLTSIPIEIVKMKNLGVVSLDDTLISQKDVDEMKKIGGNNVSIIYYN